MISLRIEYIGEARRWDDVAILEFADPRVGTMISVKAVCEPGTFTEGTLYCVAGDWSEYFNPKSRRKSKQFIADSWTGAVPETVEGVQVYLDRMSESVEGLGKRGVEKIVAVFGGGACDALRTDPISVADKCGLKSSVTLELSRALDNLKGGEKAIVELSSLLKPIRPPRGLVSKLIEDLGGRAAEKVKANPFLLVKYDGIGFRKADQFYLSLGHSPYRLKRQALAIAHCIDGDTSGHTWRSQGRLYHVAEELLGADYLRFDRSLELGIRAGLLAKKDSHGGIITTDQRLKDEAKIAATVKFDGTPWMPSVAGLELSEHQEAAIDSVRSRGGSIAVCGGPGTGKTYTVARIVSKLTNSGVRVLICAPTGKAAQRMNENLAPFGLKASTIHSLVYRSKLTNELSTADVIVIDEVSMLDTETFAWLCRECPKRVKFILVGDLGQLPPVGHGAPLRDLLAAGLPCARLTEVRRNSGTIVKACHAIVNGEDWDFDDELDLNYADPRNLVLHEAVDAKQIFRGILEKINEIGEQGNVDLIADVQVLCAINERSDVSRHKLNYELQKRLNPWGDSPKGSPFRVGDKVICLKNARYSTGEKRFNPETGLNESVKILVANGEQGIVIEHDNPKVMEVCLSNGKTVIVPRGYGDQHAGCDWDLAYAITAHKSQGSEWPVVIVALDRGGIGRICSREWFYTAISRAKRQCVCVGERRAVSEMCERVVIRDRMTQLAECITAL